WPRRAGRRTGPASRTAPGTGREEGSSVLQSRGEVEAGLEAGIGGGAVVVAAERAGHPAGTGFGDVAARVAVVTVRLVGDRFEEGAAISPAFVLGGLAA